MVIVIPGFVVTLSLIYLLFQTFGGGGNREGLSGCWGLFAGVILVVLFGAFFWYGIFDEESRKPIIEFWSDVF
jgi:hypothetical protein